MELRPYQCEVVADIHAAWAAGAKNVMPVVPTGGGKTQIFCKLLKDHKGAGVAMAHRKELVAQISLTLARWGVKHRIVAPAPTIKAIIKDHIRELGECWYDADSLKGVAGVDTLIPRARQFRGWLAQVSLGIIDEGHHVLRDNKWGRAFDLIPHAKGLMVTATPERGDGKGLGRDHDGVVDTLVFGPGQRELINAGHLCDYDIFCPLSNFDLSGVKRDSGTGDWNKKGLKVAMEKSHIVGDVVQNYLKFAKGKRGITFVDCVSTSERIAQQFRDAGVPALAVDANTPDVERAQATRDLISGKLLQLVNVDLFGEGYDVPAVEVVSFARPTESYGLYCQQFGRALRVLAGKLKAIIIDHVGNVLKHGLPDAPHEWSLAGRPKRAGSDAEPLKSCIECTKPYERFRTQCPWCGYEKPKGVVAFSAGLEEIEGDLVQLSPEVLAKMRGEVDKIDGPCHARTDDIIGRSINKKHRQRQGAQVDLRESMKWWATYTQDVGGHTAREAQKLFYLNFGVDVLSAQALGRREAEDLSTKINVVLGQWWSNHV